MGKKSLTNIVNCESCIVNSDTLSTTKHSHSLKAFSLVELSIVIVIMGLLVAGAMAGKDLLAIAKLKSVIGEIEAYKIAVNSFQVQYEALPGDIKNASSFWTSVQNGGTAVNNGNGDGMIGNNTSIDYTEPYYAWNHLSLSKFIPGTYPGTYAAPPCNTISTGGICVPASKYMDGLTFGIRYQTNPFSYTDTLGRNYIGTQLFIAANSLSANNCPTGNIFTTTDALYIDSKIDNGLPTSGKILGGGSCTTGSPVVYDTSLSGPLCRLVATIIDGQ